MKNTVIFYHSGGLLSMTHILLVRIYCEYKGGYTDENSRSQAAEGLLTVITSDLWREESKIIKMPSARRHFYYFD